MTAVDAGDDAFESAVAELFRLHEDHPDRARRAASLVEALLARPLDSSNRLFRHVDHLLAAADLDPPSTPSWPRTRCAARVMSLMYTIAYDTSVDLGPIEAELDAMAAEVVGDQQLAALLQCAQTVHAVRLASERDDGSMLRRLPEMVAGLGATLPGHPGLAQIRQVLGHSAEMVVANRRGDAASTWAQFDLMQAALQNLPDSHLRAAMIPAAEPLAMFRTLLDEDGSLRRDRLTDEQTAAFMSLADSEHVDPTMGRLAAGMAYLGMGTETDVSRIDEGIARFRQVVADTPRGDRERSFCLLSLALALYRRSEATGRTDDLPEARAALVEARDLLDGPQHPQWTFVNELLAGVDQRSGDFAAVPDSALNSQRGYLWRILLETDLSDARRSIEEAARNALENARRCITVGDPGNALMALDAGRALMLFAATELHRIPARLHAVGRTDLAQEWSQNGTPSDRLRRQVVEALTALSTDTLFDPPTLTEVQSALALLDADALVYLVPDDPPHGGMAVLAPAVGPPAFMALPHLHLAAGTDVERYLTALATRDLEPMDTEDFAERVDALCDWAWRAAMGPVLESYLPRLPAPPHGRPSRIVLIPMGDLARVPWHAARRKDGVHAVQLAAISQAVSARLLCANAALPPVPLGSTGLIVGDPDIGVPEASLRSARLEALAIRQAFYRGARYVGRLSDERSSPSPSGTGTAAQVRAWLVDRSPWAGVMLHLACHGFYDSGAVPGACLLLAGDGSADDGNRGSSELDVDELVDLLASVPDRAIALVVLAACNSGRSVYGYDEAYSIGTGLLAGGVRSVLSTQWSVPDAATSSLMYLFHHHLRHDGVPAWQALRQAQMWMLDPHRKPPPAMPAELVPGADDDPKDVLAWAGFVHYGQ